MSEGIYGITEKKCPMCGKKFIPAPLHVYKRNYGRRAYKVFLQIFLYDRLGQREPAQAASHKR